MSNLKQLFEGRGGMISTNKHVRFERLMKDGLFFVSSNELPVIAHPDDRMYGTEWVPFTARCELIKMTRSFSGLTEFPYDAPMLASALMQLTDVEKSRSREIVPPVLGSVRKADSEHDY